MCDTYETKLHAIGCYGEDLITLLHKSWQRAKKLREVMPDEIREVIVEGRFELFNRVAKDLNQDAIHLFSEELTIHGESALMNEDRVAFFIKTNDSERPQLLQVEAPTKMWQKHVKTIYLQTGPYGAEGLSHRQQLIQYINTQIKRKTDARVEDGGEGFINIRVPARYADEFARMIEG